MGKIQNLSAINLLKRTKDLCNIAITKLHESNNVENSIDKKTLTLFQKEWGAILDIAEDAFNEKTKIPLNTQHIALVKAATESSVTYASRIIFRERMALMDKTGKFMTAKQLGKFQNEDLKSQLPMCVPDSRDTGVFLRYYGLSCTKCDSFMVRELADVKEGGSNLQCIKYDNAFKEKTVVKYRFCQISLYKENLIRIIKTGNYENCKCRNHKMKPYVGIIICDSGLKIHGIRINNAPIPIIMGIK
ncbi:hypothetical protein K0U27_07095 [archaeon]|nr:hypothetical protein [archaeon]